MSNQPFPFINPGSYQHFLNTVETYTQEHVHTIISEFDHENCEFPVHILPLMTALSHMMWSKQYDMVDYFLEKYPFDRANKLAVITVMRTLYSASEKLTNYRPALQQAAQRITELGEDPQKLLHGLFDKYQSIWEQLA